LVGTDRGLDWIRRRGGILDFELVTVVLTTFFQTARSVPIVRHCQAGNDSSEVLFGLVVQGSADSWIVEQQVGNVAGPIVGYLVNRENDA
jgi:hypothetical protein